MLRLTSGITKRGDATFSTGAGNGGLDAGSLPTSGGVYVYLISEDVIFSTSAPSTGPSGYSSNEYAYIGWRPTDSSANFYLVRQDGPYHEMLEEAIFYNAANPGTSDVTVTAPAPPGSIARLWSFFRDSATSAAFRDFYVGATDVSPAVRRAQIQPAAGMKDSSDELLQVVDSSQQFKYRISSSAATVAVLFSLAGWIDPRIEGLGT